MTNPREQWQQLQVRLLILYDQEVSKTYRGKEFQVASPNWTFWLLRQGSVCLRPPVGREIRADAGEGVLIPPDYHRVQYFSDDSRMLSLHFTATWPGNRRVYEMPGPLVRPLKVWPELEPVARDWLAARDCQENGLESFARLEACRFNWLAAWSRIMAREGIPLLPLLELDPRVEAVVNFLNTLDYQAEIPYGELCRLGGLSRVHLDRLFLQQVGRTPRRHLDDRCLQRASSLLLTTRLPVKTICYQLGFQTTAHFTNWFRRQAGCSPVTFRRTLPERPA